MNNIHDTKVTYSYAEVAASGLIRDSESSFVRPPPVGMTELETVQWERDMLKLESNRLRQTMRDAARVLRNTDREVKLCHEKIARMADLIPIASLFDPENLL